MVHKGQAEADAALLQGEGDGQGDEAGGGDHQVGEGKAGRSTDKNNRKRKRPRRKKKRHHQQQQDEAEGEGKQEAAPAGAGGAGLEAEVEYVSYQPQSEEDRAAFEAFRDIFGKFAPPEELCLPKEERERLAAAAQAEGGEGGEGGKGGPSSSKGDGDGAGGGGEGDGDGQGEDEEDKLQMSKRERKKQKRLSVAVLKQLVTRPEVVEVWDVTSSDPALLVYLKSYRNAVPVPRHWCQKRKYLQGKRGLEKRAFELPEFIAATGITRIRQAIQEQEEQKRAKQKQREKMQPKMGKMDIDYQVLHDAFFRYQTKPKLTGHGDTYYEGKEFEVKLKEKKPGLLSDDLKEALGMPEGSPPPWLINMQRYGPPPSYPNLKIPGLNAPIPVGSQFGYHPGGWGKPPVDQFGKPLYGDVFGAAAATPADAQAPIDRKHWGELEEEEDYESEEEESSDEEGEKGDEEEGEEEQEAPSKAAPPESGLVTPTGLATPDHLVLRKKDAQAEAAAEQAAQPLYRVLPQREMAVGGAAFGSSHGYVVPGAADAAAAKKGKDAAVNLIKSQRTKEMEFTLSETDVANLTDDRLQEMFEAKVASSAPAKEDVSDVIAEHAKKKKAASTKDKKKWQEFKFLIENFCVVMQPVQ
jgi:splicing factor 3B subunit 2